MSEIWVQSMVSHRTRKPMVSIYWPKDKEAIQISPDEARSFALSIIESAEAAEQDAFLFEFMTKQIGTDEQGAARILSEFRKHRGQEEGP